MTNEERKLALYCLKANSDFHKEVCEECIQYPECDHFIQDSVMEKLIEALEQESNTDILDKIKTEIEKVKAIMNEEIIEHNRKDLINFINGINQCLVIIAQYRE